MLMRIHKFIFFSICLFLLASCGDDSSSTKVVYADKVYSSVEELPDCNKKLGNVMASVGESHYFCTTNKWVKIDGYVKGVCNLELCDDSLDEQYVYASEAKNVYLCKSNAWSSFDGDEISNDEYIECALDILIKSKVNDEDSLGICDKAHDGDLVSVENDIYACTEKAWVKIKTEVISETDLPKCSTNGQYAFVLSKMKAYQCKDGKWIKDGESVEPSATTSASESTPSSSSVNEVKNEDVVPSKPKTDDTTKVRGICIPTETNIEKGDEVRWTFINMGGTPVSFDWSFSSRTPITSSNKMGPFITYPKGGIYKASVIVNKGLPSESDEIVCSNLTVTSESVLSGCKCSSETSMGAVSENKPYSAIWNVSGCQGQEPFSYDWDKSNTIEETLVYNIDTKGTYHPSVTVYDDDGASMSLTCPDFIAHDPLSASCSVDAFQFSANISVPDELKYSYQENGYMENRNLEFVCYVNDEEPKTYTASSWGAFINMPLDGDYNSFHKATLVYGNDTLCSEFSKLTCSADQLSVEKNTPTSWHVSSLADYSATTVNWTFYDKDNNVLKTSDERTPTTKFDFYGTVRATALIDKGTKFEHTASCSLKMVVPVTGCSCESAELVSESNDLALLDSVGYKFTVTGCAKSDAAGTLSYEWEGSLLESNSHVIYYKRARSYEPSVWIYNEMGEYQHVYCPEVEVIESELESSSSEEVESSSSEEPEIPASSSSETPVVPASSSSEEPEMSASSSSETPVVPASSSNEVPEMPVSSSSETPVAPASSSSESIEVPEPATSSSTESTEVTEDKSSSSESTEETKDDSSSSAETEPDPEESSTEKDE